MKGEQRALKLCKDQEVKLLSVFTLYVYKLQDSCIGKPSKQDSRSYKQ